MGQSKPYRCILLDNAGEPVDCIDLRVETDTDAVLLGNTLGYEHSACSGFELRDGDRLVYMHKDDNRQR